MTRHWHVVVEYSETIGDSAAVTCPADLRLVASDPDGRPTTLSFRVTAPTPAEAAEAARARARSLCQEILQGIVVDEIPHPGCPDQGPEAGGESGPDSRLTADEVVDTTQACHLLGIRTPRQFYDLERTRRDFPPVWKQLGNNRRLYSRADIESFGRRWERRPGRPRKTR